MASGGARARSGPPPDPNALRRERDSGDWVTLPEDGRKGRAPAWPLAGQTERESSLWDAEWKRPQAVMWERHGLEVEVAIYVRTLTAAESPDASPPMRTLLRQQQEALGLSLPGLARNKWRIGAAEKPQTKRRPQRPSARDRFTVVAGGDGGD